MATAAGIFPTAPSPRPLYTDQVEHLLKLQKWSQKISSILDLDQLIEQIATEVACSFGCVEANVYLHENTDSTLVLAGVHGCTLHGKGHRLRIGQDGMVGHVASTRKLHYAPDVRIDPYYIPCEDDTLSEVAIPLLVEDELIGVFTASRGELDAFTPEHIRLLQGLCNHVSVAVHNARRFQRERQALEKINREAQEARTIQQALLPRSSPLIPGFQVTGRSVPAGEVGGDWFDFIPLEKGRWGLVLADVSGKGIPAALLMSATRGMLRSMASTCDSPSVILERLNKLLIADFPAGKFVTLIYGVLDPEARTLTFSSAGHLQPLRIGPQDACFMDSERGIPLGIGAAEFSERVVVLPEGTRLIFYSDGITEAAGAADEEYGPQRLLAHARQPDASVESILDDVRKFANGAGLHDDATVIVVNA